MTPSAAAKARQAGRGARPSQRKIPSAQGTTPEECPHGRRKESGDKEQAGHDPKSTGLQGGAVVKDQRVRQEGEAQVVDDRGELGEGVAPPGDAAAEARGPPA